MKAKILKVAFSYYGKGIGFDITEHGYIEVETFDRERLWDICNWSCYQENKPANLFSDIMVASSNIIFHNPVSDEYHFAKPMGWETFMTYESLIKYCLSCRKDGKS